MPMNTRCPQETDLLVIPETRDFQQNTWQDLTFLSSLYSSLLCHSFFSSVVDKFIEVLKQAVYRRISTTSNQRIGILFSGGVDCSLLALLADQLLSNDEPIELMNVAFQPLMTSLPNSKDKAIDKDLASTNNCDFNVPDRRTGINSWKELSNINTKREWKFVAINVDSNELKYQKKERISSLVYPLKTVLDDSLGSVMWFASRGNGVLLNSEEIYLPYKSEAKVLLVGSGADELMGGYSRHRVRFEKAGWASFAQELERDFKRIATRNLGRDDRVIADHGRESRLPYLDEDVVNFLQPLPVSFKSDPRLPRGIGEKILIRAAAFRCGLKGSAFEAKRAMQFGSRITKAEGINSKKVKATDLVF